MTTVAAADPQPSDWIGTWVPIAGGQSIRIARGGDAAFEVTGEATWQGGRNEAGEPIVHVGSFRGTAAPSGSLLTVEDGEAALACTVRMQQVSHSLVVDDNGRCGGVNVTFGGVYRRKPQPAARDSGRAPPLTSGTASPARER